MRNECEGIHLTIKLDGQFKGCTFDALGDCLSEALRMARSVGECGGMNLNETVGIYPFAPIGSGGKRGTLLVQFPNYDPQHPVNRDNREEALEFQIQELRGSCEELTRQRDAEKDRADRAEADVFHLGQECADEKTRAVSYRQACMTLAALLVDARAENAGLKALLDEAVEYMDADSSDSWEEVSFGVRHRAAEKFFADSGGREGYGLRLASAAVDGRLG